MLGENRHIKKEYLQNVDSNCKRKIEKSGITEEVAKQNLQLHKEIKLNT